MPDVSTATFATYEPLFMADCMSAANDETLAFTAAVNLFLLIALFISATIAFVSAFTVNFSSVPFFDETALSAEFKPLTSILGDMATFSFRILSSIDFIPAEVLSFICTS